ncbi:MAG: DUF6078 family protein [Mediterranea sp.]|jgi:hypothetical protein|nr:DUF6078 family protein [Mediterranea sp.]
METFDFSQVPYGFVACASAGCAKASTCLRHIALEHAPLTSPYMPTLTPAFLKAMKEECTYYRSDVKVRYARGFTGIIGHLTVTGFRAFKARLIGRYGRKYYFMYRKGDRPIKPADQQYIIHTAQAFGLQLDDYFDAYFEDYLWED